MKQIYANNLTTLSLGRQGENLARQVVFDIRDLESLYGHGDVEVIHQRPGDAQPYPLAVQRNGTLVTWNVTATDTEMSAATANERYGKCELRYYAGETLAKSQIWRTWVESAMGTPSETAPPEPEQGWVDQVLAVGVSVKEAADSVKTYANSAEQSASGAAQSAQEAAGNASAASTSATNAKASEESAADSASAAANSATSASAAASAASGSASAAKASETAAKASEEAAKASEAAAKASETAAAESASSAQQSATSAAESAAVYDTVVADVNQLKQDTVHQEKNIVNICESGSIDIRGSDHKYYFGGGIDKSVHLTNAMTTRVFPIIENATYRLTIAGNAKTIGFANEEFTTEGTLLDSKVLDDYSCEFTNVQGHKYLYVYCSKDNDPGRCTLYLNGNIILRSELNAYKQSVHNTYNDTSEITIDKSLYEKGYLYPNGKGFDYSENYYHSNYIRVEELRKVTVKNFCVSAGYVLHFFDKDMNAVLNLAKTTESTTIDEKVYEVPAKAKYIRYTCKADQIETTSIEYSDAETKDYISNKVTLGWYSDSYSKISKIFANATKKPICCIIDDDTQSESFVNQFVTICETQGIKGTMACLTSNLPNVLDSLKAAERKGHQVVLHGYNQIEDYRYTDDDERYALAEDDFVHGLSDLVSNGFCNPKFWVTPYGVHSERVQKIAKKWGMECLVAVTANEYETTEAKYGRYALRRCGLNPTDSGSMTQAQLLELATKCAEENGWLLVCMHVYDGWGTDFTRFNEFVNYCKELGYEFLTLGEAWQIRKPIYEWYETF